MRIAVGMSGGIDSTYTAYILKKQGHDVEGVTLVMHDYTDISAAEKACDAVGIKLNVVDCRKQFEENVITDFIEEYSNGRTPNPCTVCNRLVKFEELTNFAEINNFDKIATGHYAEVIQNDDGRFCIKKGQDIKKDQSYMLWYLTQRQLNKIMFPLSVFNKEDIKKECESTALSYLKDKKESQEICFIPDNDYAKYIENIKGKFKEGNFVDKNGKILGKHRGIIHYTVGQRKGLGIALGAPAFITNIDAQSNTITVEKMGDVLSDEFKVGKLNFQSLDENITDEIELDVKIRYAAQPARALVTIQNNKAIVKLLSPVRAITPGQSAVFYQNDKIAFGGVIEQ